MQAAGSKGAWEKAQDPTTWRAGMESKQTWAWWVKAGSWQSTSSVHELSRINPSPGLKKKGPTQMADGTSEARYCHNHSPWGHILGGRPSTGCKYSSQHLLAEALQAWDGMSWVESRAGMTRCLSAGGRSIKALCLSLYMRQWCFSSWS